jgi:hypothetical protein
MNSYRSAALAVATCAAGLSMAACTAGISTVSSPPTSPAASSHRASAAASSPSPASPGRTIVVNGSAVSFPVPAGAKVVENVAIGQQGTVVIFEFVAPAQVSSFYAAALPRAGYTIIDNAVLSQSGGTDALIQFTGHGYKGNVDALSNYPNPGVRIPGLGRKNVTTITFMPK